MEKFLEMLGTDLANQVKAKIGDAKFFIGEGEFIPKGRFDEVNNQVKDYKGQIAERDRQIDTLSKNAKGNEDLLKQIEDLKATNAKNISDYEAKISAREKDYLIDSALSSAKSKNNKAVKSLLDLEKVTVKDGKLEGITEQIEALRKSDSYLFATDQQVPPNKLGGLEDDMPGKKQLDNPTATKRWNAHKTNKF